MISPTNAASLARAAALLRSGELVAFPTETVYGLGANALDERAVQRIYEAKGRPATSPLIVHVDSVAMARSLASLWPAAAEVLARSFWPGPLTLVVPKAAHVPDAVTAGLPSVGLRLPAHEAARALITAAHLPLAAPSANRFTGLSPTTAQHVESALGARVLLILDGGPCQVGIESTVVSVSAQGVVTLLRPGMITSTQLEAVLGHPLAAPAKVNDGEAHLSPGQHQKHYSPRTPVFIAGRDAVPPTSKRVLRLNAASLPAAELYATLHRADEAAKSYDAILVELPPDTPEWAAVRDRLLRAAAQVI
jgi:L-threonylcarbamoyladenylate synthase